MQRYNNFRLKTNSFEVCFIQFPISLLHYLGVVYVPFRAYGHKKNGRPEWSGRQYLKT